LDEVALLLDVAVLQATALSLEPPTSRRISDGASREAGGIKSRDKVNFK